MYPDPNYRIGPGMTVVGADNQKVGRIVDVSRGHLLVEKGFFFPADYYIPAEQIVDIVGDHVYLRVTKDEALHRGWDRPPDPTDGVAAETGVRSSDSGSPTPEEPDFDGGNVDHLASEGTDTIRVPVYAEELTAVTRDVDRGAILIEKELVTEHRTITVPVTEERVRVTRVPAGTPGSVGAEAFENGAIEIPVRGQDVDVEKIARMSSEVVVEKEQVDVVKRFDAAVRREDVRIEDDNTFLDHDRDRNHRP